MLLVQNCSTLRANTKRIVLVSTSSLPFALSGRNNCRVCFIDKFTQAEIADFSGITIHNYSFLKDTIKVLCNSNHRIVNRC